MGYGHQRAIYPLRAIISSSATENNNNFYNAQLTIFKGILQEKKYRNSELAQKFYEKGISDISLFSDFGNEYAAYAYFGLSRISEFKGEKHIKEHIKKRLLNWLNSIKLTLTNE